MKLRKLALIPAAVAMTFAWAGAATAVDPVPLPLTLTAAGQQEIGPQSTSNPCIIAATNCSQPDGFGFNDYTQKGSIPSYDIWSTTPTNDPNDQHDGPLGTSPYTVGQLTALGSTTFTVAIDVNTTGAAGETLQLFEVWNMTNDTVLYNYAGPTVIGGVSNNGNGYADWTLGTFSLLNLPTDTLIQFHAVWNNATDGGESFFLVPNTPAVPEPETYAMMLAGLGLLGFVARRRRQSFGNVLPA